MSTSSPPVSCLMPTANRRAFVPLAIEGFLGQDYPDRELVILDDGGDPVADLVPDDPRVRYQRLATRTTLGAKRNLACEAARGQVLVHWDDDDWYAPDRISRQVRALDAAGADVCGVSSLLFYDPRTEAAWRYRYPDRSGRPWVAGSSMCYRRGFWERYPFQPVATGEDTRFLWRNRSAKILALRDEQLLVALVHGANTCTVRTNGSRWSRVPASQVVDLMGDRATRYQAAARGAPSPPAPVAVQPPRRPGAGAPRSHRAVPDDRGQERAGADLGPVDHVTVAIPFHRCRPYVRRAVQSILHQTHQNLTVVVVNDGDPVPPWDLLADIDDPRLVRFDLGANRGRYFADAVVLGATSSHYYLVQDADDWSEPNRVDAVFSALYSHTGGVEAQHLAVLRYPDLARPLTNELEHRASHFGLYTTQALRRVGGYYGGFRIGYDTLLISLLLMAARVAYLERPLYHWSRRRGSLTMSAATGLRSSQRREVRRQLREMYADALRAYRRHQAGRFDADALAVHIRQLVSARVPAGDRELLAAASARLVPLLADARGAHHPPEAAAEAPATAAARPGPPPDVDTVIAGRELTWGGWAIHRSTAVELTARLDARRPRRILEVGSGTSTAVLAAGAAAHGAELVTLEHEPRWYRRTQALLERLGLADRVDLRLAGLAPRRCADSDNHLWYATELEGPFDFVFVDGPPRSAGRAGVLFSIFGQLAEGWEVWLKNGHRRDERDCVARWREHLPVTAVTKDLEETGVTILNAATDGAAASPAVPPGLGIAILSQGRWRLLEQTVEALERHLPGVGKAGPMVVLAAVPETTQVEYAVPGAVDLLICEQAAKAGGAAAGRLARALTRTSTMRYALLLQEGMLAATADDRALVRAAEILDRRPDVSQVGLWHHSERHAHGADPALPALGRADRVGITLGPSLVRAADIPALFPAGRPPGTQRRPRGDVALPRPGVFRWSPPPPAAREGSAGGRRAAL
jgi:glycosyltransferase involved in cell wall biosynthesis/predicted O-methyltransferase YrrM